MRVWRNGPRFWRIFPWVVSVPLLWGMSFFTFYVSQAIFKDDSIYVVMWVEALIISLVQGWFIQDILVIVVRNNVKFTKTRIRTAKYQTLEKFFLAPFGLLWALIRSSVIVD